MTSAPWDYPPSYGGWYQVRMRGTLADRFEAKVDRNGPIPAHRPELGPCHVWMGSRNEQGYGKLGMGPRAGGIERAHRVAFFLAEGRWPEPCCLHHCDNRACVKAVADDHGPSHLFEGTKADNSRDMAAKGRAAFQAHPESAPRGANHWHAKHPGEGPRGDVAGAKRVTLARLHNVTPQNITAIVSGKTWRHLLNGG